MLYIIIQFEQVVTELSTLTETLMIFPESQVQTELGLQFDLHKNEKEDQIMCGHLETESESRNNFDIFL